MRHFAYKFADYFMNYGPLLAEDLDDAKAKVRQRLGVRRLPKGLKVWDVAEKPFERWVVQERLL